MAKSFISALLATAFLAVTRFTIFARSSCVPVSRCYHFLIHYYEAFQLFTIALSEEYPSGQDLPSVLRTAIEVVGQPLISASKNGAPMYAIVAFTAGAMGGVALGGVYCCVKFASLQDFEFQRVLAGHMKLPLQAVATVTITLSLVCVELLFVPVLVWANSDPDTQAAISPLQSLLAVEACVCELLFSDTRLGSRNFGALSRPVFAIYRKLFLLAFVTGVTVFPYSSHKVLHELTYLLPAAFWLYEVCVKLPYHQDSLNDLEAGKGLGVWWAGVVLVIADLNGLRGTTVTAMLILTYAGVLVVLLLAMQAYEASIKRKTIVSFSFELELRLRWHLQAHLVASKLTRPKELCKLSKDIRAQLDSPAIDCLCRNAYSRFARDPVALMCLIDFFLLLKAKTFVKVILHSLQNIEASVLSLLDIACLETAAMTVITKSKSENDAANFIKTYKSIGVAKRLDEIMTFYMSRIAELFQAPSLSARDMSKILSIYDSALERAKKMYEAMYQTIGDNKDFVVLYLGFLRFLREEEKIPLLELRMKQINQANQSRQRLGDESVLFLDELNCIFVISLDESNPGRIIKARNAHLLGYLDSELTDNSCFILIPRIAHSIHSTLFKLIYQYRHNSPIYSGSQTVYAVSKDGYLRRVVWKIRIVNYEWGRIGALIAMRLMPDDSEFAFIDGNRISQTTEMFGEVLTASQSRSALQDKIAELHAWPANQPLLECSGPFGQVIFSAQSWQMSNNRSSKVIVMESKSMLIPQKVPSAKEVGFIAIDTSLSKTDKQYDTFGLTLVKEIGAIRKIKRYLWSQQKAIKWVLVLSAVCIPVSVLGQIGIVIDIQSQVADMSLDFSFINLVASLRAKLQTLAIDVRETQLHTVGVEFDRSDANLRSDLFAHADELGTLAEDLLNLAGQGFQIITTDNIVWWESRGTGWVFTVKNSVDLASMLASKARKLAAADNPDISTIREILRNAPAESLSSLNSLVKTRILYHQEHNEPDKIALILPLFASFYSLSLLLFILVVSLLVSIGRHRLWIWYQLAGVNAETMIAFHLTVIQRLEEIHNIELQLSHQRNSRTLKFSMHPIQIGLWSTALLLFAASIGFFQFNYESAFVSLQTTQYQQPFVVYTTSAQKSLIASAIFWLREMTTSREFDLHSLFPDNNQIAFPSQQLRSIVSSIEHDEKSLRGMFAQYSSDLVVSADHFAFLFNTQKAASLVPELHCGYVPGLSQLSDALFTCIEEFTDLSGGYQRTCARTEQAAYALLNQTETSKALYLMDSDVYVSTAIATATMIILLFAGAAVPFLLLIFLPVALSLRAVCVREGKLLPLLLKMAGKETQVAGKTAQSTCVRGSIT